MTPARLIECRRIVRWSRLTLAQATGRDEKQIRRWDEGATIPGDVAAWLEKLARYHERNPPPAR